MSLRKSLKKRPLDYFKNDFWADTAAFTADTGDQGRHGVLPDRQDRVRLRLPVRSGRRHHVPARDAEDLESLKMDKATSDKVFYKNLEAVTGKKLVK